MHKPSDGFVPIDNFTPAAVSADGTTVAGTAGATSDPVFVVWTAEGGLLPFGTGESGNGVTDISADGTTVIGFGPSREAFLWTALDGLVGLGHLGPNPDGEYYSSSASAVSADGSVVVGVSSSPNGYTAFIWDAQHGMRQLANVLETEYQLDLDGWTLTKAIGISDDGLTIVGRGNEGWVARISDSIAGPPSAPPHVVFLPGFAGSRLYKDGVFGDNTLWIPNSEGDLCDLQPDRDGSVGEDVYTKLADDGGLILSELEQVSPPPAIADTDIYGDFVSYLQALERRGAISGWSAYPYDWRRSVVDIARAGDAPDDTGILIGNNGDIDLRISLTQEIIRLANDAPVVLIGHSNGGLLAKAIVAEFASRIENGDLGAMPVAKVILVGTPQLGTPAALKGLLHGEFVEFPRWLFLSNAVKRKSAENMIGAHLLLPSPKFDDFYGMVQFQPNDASSVEPIPVLRAYKNSDLATGVGGAKLVTAYDELRAFLLGEVDNRLGDLRDCDSIVLNDDEKKPHVLARNILEEAERVHLMLEQEEIARSVDLIEVAGIGVPTPRSIVYRHCNANLYPGCTPRTLEHSDVLTELGDGTVVSKSALASGAQTFLIRLDEFNETTAEPRVHDNIMGAAPVEGLIQAIIENWQNPAESVDFVEPAYNTGNLRRPRQAIVYSAVRLIMYDELGRRTGFQWSPESELSYGIAGIPNTSADRSSGHPTISFLEGRDYRFVVEGTSFGNFSIVLRDFIEDTWVEDAVVTNLPASPTMVAEFALGTDGSPTAFEIDFDGDEVVDAVVDTGSGNGPSRSLEVMISLIRSLELDGGIEKSLIAKLDGAFQSLQTGSIAGALGQMRAFTMQVRALRGKKLPEAMAEGLEETARQVLRALG